MARLNRAQLEAKIARLTDDLAKANEKVEDRDSTIEQHLTTIADRDSTIRGLNAEIGRKDSTIEQVNRANESLREELQLTREQRDQVLLLVESAVDCLKPAFGDMQFHDAVSDGTSVLVVLKAADGLALVTLDPADRSLTLTDSDDNVDSIRVDIGQNGKLTRPELKAIRDFRGQVLLARTVSNGHVLGDELDMLAAPNGVNNGLAAALVTKS